MTMKAIYQYDNDGSIIIKTAAGTTHRFASASAAVNWCNRNNVTAYQQADEILME